MTTAIGNSTITRRYERDVELERLKGHPEALRIFTSRLRFTKIDTRKYRAHCPFHADSTASFDVYVYQNVWIYKCLGCGVTGNVCQFVERYDNVSFLKARQIVSDHVYGVGKSSETVEPAPRAVLPAKPKVHTTSSLAQCARYERDLALSEQAMDWLLEQRGIDYSDAKLRSILRLGYRQVITSIVPELQDILSCGWIVFPSFGSNKVTLYKYRSIARKAFARQPGMETSLFNAGSIDAINEWYATEDVYVTEGEFDAAVLVQAHLRAVSIGSTTTRITPEMLDQLKRAKRVVLAGDNDGGVGTAKMQDLQTKIPGSILLKWPVGVKDANELWLRDYRGDIEGFRQRVIALAEEGTTWKA
jgi:DNA primase